MSVDEFCAYLTDAEERNRDLATAATVRRDWARALLGPGPKSAERRVWLDRLAAWYALDLDPDPRRVAYLLGLTLQGGTQDERRAELQALALAATPDVCQRIVHAVALAELDPADSAGEWTHRPDVTRMVMRVLDVMGYQASDVERTQLAELGDE